MLAILKILAWLISVCLIGWSILSIVFYKRKLLTIPEKLVLSYAVGLGLITIGMAKLSFLKIPFSSFSILIWWLPIVFIGIYLDIKSRSIPYYRIEGEKTKLSLLEKFFICGISFEVLYTFFRALIKPLEAYDAIAIYGMKAKIFYLAKAIPPDFFSHMKDYVPHVDYPLLLPLAETYFYTFFGSLNDLLVKVMFPLYFIAILVTLYFVIRRYASRKISLLFTFLLATIPQLTNYATNGYADMLFAFYYSASIFYIYLWIKEKSGLFLTLSFIMLALGIWTKNEGIALVVVNIAIIAIYLLSEGKKFFKQGLSYVFFILVGIAFYTYIKGLLGLGVINADYMKVGSFGAGKTIMAIKRIPWILYEYQRQFFGPKKWNIIWIIFILMFITGFKSAFSKDTKFLILAILFTFGVYTFVYMVTPFDLRWHLSTSASRLFIHFLPLVVLWCALSFKERGWNL